MKHSNPILPNQPMDHGRYYGAGTDKDNAVYGYKNGYSPLGESFTRGLQRQVDRSDYSKIIDKRYAFAKEYLGNAYERVYGGEEAAEDRRWSGVESRIDTLIEQTKRGDLAEGEQSKKILEAIKELTKEYKNSNKKRRGGGGGGDASEGGEDENDEKQDAYEQLKKWYESWDSEQKNVRGREALVALCFQQVIDIAKNIETGIKEGRNAANKLYESNVSSVVSRGVATKGEFSLEKNAIGSQLLADNLYANLKINDIYQGYIDLVNKGYSDKDAEALAYSDAITKKIAPYLDTQTTAFKDLQSKFGQTFMNQISGMNNYIQEIAGSAKVFESNINSIITSLEPIQLWAETQMWGEDELAALDYLVEQGGMTQSEAAQLIQSALKVSTGTYASVTGGTVAEKVAVATGQTDFGSAITSILQTAGLASSSNRTAQGAALSQLIGGTGFLSEVSDIPQVLSMFSDGLTLARSSSSSASKKTAENLEALQKGQMSSTSELKETMINNSGSMLSFMQDFAPDVIDRLDKVFNMEHIIELTTTYIASLQARQLYANAAGQVSGIAQGLMGSGASLATTAASAGTAALPIIGALALGIGAVVGTTALVKGISDNAAKEGEFVLPSYDVGSDYIEKDQLAVVHEGEAVLTPEENAAYKRNKQLNLSSSLLNNTITISVEQEEKNDRLIRELRETTEKIITAIKTYCQEERVFTYDEDTVNLKSKDNT